MKYMRSLFRKFYRVLPFKRKLFVLLRLFRFPESLYKHLHFTGEIGVTVSPTIEFRMMHWGNQVENDLFWAGYGNNWESTSLRLWAHLVPQADLIMDIGANTGVYALAAQSLSKSTEVLAFEPVSRVYQKLEKNLQLNDGNTAAFNIALSDEEGEVVMYDLPSDHVYSASLNPKMLSGRDQAVIESKVQATRMDSFLRDREVPLSTQLLIKIDVEMHELEVISGFGEAIAERRPMFLIEILNRELGSSLAEKFSQLNYQYYEVHESVGLQKVDSLGEAERNYFICPNELVEKIGLQSNISHDDLVLTK